MTDRSSFSILRGRTDLYLMDIKTGAYRKLGINSERTDSYHCWASNSRWFAFISKRDNGVFARVYFSYIDGSGKVYKPFVLPQKDPYFYDTFTSSYNVPELIKRPMEINRFSFGRKISAVDKITEVDLGEDVIEDSGVKNKY